MRDHASLFLKAHLPKLKNDPSDLEQMVNWRNFITSLGRSHIVAHFLDDNRINFFQGLADPAMTVFSQWIAKSLNFEIIHPSDLKSALIQGFARFQGKPEIYEIVLALNNFYSYFSEPTWGGEMINIRNLLAGLDGEPDFISELNTWKNIFGLPPFTDDEVNELKNLLSAIDWSEFYSQTSIIVQQPEFLAVVEMYHQARRVIKKLGEEVLEQQIALISSQTTLSSEFLSQELVRGFLQTSLDYLGGMEDVFILEFLKQFFIHAEREIDKIERGLSGQEEVWGETIAIVFNSAMLEMKSAVAQVKNKAMKPQTSSGQLTDLVREYDLRLEGLAREAAEEAVLWLQRVPTFIAFWANTYFEYNKLAILTKMETEDFLPKDSPTVTRDCVGRIVINKYFTFLFENYVPGFKAEQIVIVPKPS